MKYGLSDNYCMRMYSLVYVFRNVHSELCEFIIIYNHIFIIDVCSSRTGIYTYKSQCILNMYTIIMYSLYPVALNEIFQSARDMEFF